MSWTTSTKVYGGFARYTVIMPLRCARSEVAFAAQKEQACGVETASLLL